MARKDEASDSDGSINILLALSLCHFINDMLQSLLPSIYPILKASFTLTFTQVGLITMTYQVTASLLQPLVGYYTDKRPKPYSLPFGMALTLSGLVTLSQAGNFTAILIGAALIGSGSAVFHPESSRIARAASGGRHGFAQSFFQVGGNAGTAFGPLLAAYIIVPHGQESICWFAADALLAICLLTFVSTWHKSRIYRRKTSAKPDQRVRLSRKEIVFSLFILIVLVFSKYFYLASINNYYTFYLMNKFHLSIRGAQVCLFAFLFAVAAGTLIGGHIGDRIGRRRVIFGSIVGALPFTVLLPHADLFGTVLLSIMAGFIIASAFSAIIVYAQELVPGKTGMIAGLFFGFAFGMGGLGAAVLGNVADHTSIGYVYELCAWLPVLGLLTIFLPEVERASHSWRKSADFN